jgi:hypothetical protein
MNENLIAKTRTKITYSGEVVLSEAKRYSLLSRQTAFDFVESEKENAYHEKTVQRFRRDGFKHAVPGFVFSRIASFLAVTMHKITPDNVCDNLNSPDVTHNASVRKSHNSLFIYRLFFILLPPDYTLRYIQT